MNKDDAFQYIDIAVQCMAAGKFDRAEKLLLKAEKLYSTKKAKDLLKEISLKRESQPGARGPSSNAENIHKRSKSDASFSDLEYTRVQLEAVLKVKECKDLYEILGVTKSATDSEIKKAYKKLALQLHPDKNRAPGAGEAFKAVGNAAAVLTDFKKRKQYDFYSQQSNIPSGFAYPGGPQADVGAEEFFNTFFGDDHPQRNAYARSQRPRRQRETAESQASLMASISLMFILFLFCLSVLSTLFTSDPIYNLSRSPEYPVKRVTNNHKVAYYVSENFHLEYTGYLNVLEKKIEEDYHNHLRLECNRERSKRESMLFRARSFNDRHLYYIAQALAMPACDALREAFGF